MFSRVLIANRGEIAVRIIRACRELGIATIAVYSDADATARHVVLADAAIRIGPASPAESYLSVAAIVDAARRSGADAVHPGYGFLSENPALADACEAAGLTFIGPPAAVLEQMGSKIAARRIAAAAGVPVVPGVTPHDQSDAAIVAAVRALGLPVLLKPSEGGGGIGMKVVRDEATLVESIPQARREAERAFGDGTLYAERLIDRPRHVEVQVMADAHGQVVHLFERECSLQRRHQKVIEESPSPALTPALRARMGDAAVALARGAGYRNAGTVEFLLDGQGDDAAFYFLEMNTRLQVEHPVTEMVTGIDLVHTQLQVAAGQPLPWTQDALRQRGHAFEARLYAEDPGHDDLPQAGPLRLFRPPLLPGVRLDSGYVEGDTVSVHYDPLIAKLIAVGDSREIARRRLVEALRQFPILGIRTNAPFLLAMLDSPAVVNGDLDTGLIDREGLAWRQACRVEPGADVLAVAEAARRAAATAAPGAAATALPGGPAASIPSAIDPWLRLGALRV